MHSNNKVSYKETNTCKRQKLSNKKIDKIMVLLKKSKISSENYDSTEFAFFEKNIMDDFYKDNKIITNLPESLNRNIKLIYYLLGNPDKEIYLAEWTIMSVNKALKVYEDKCKYEQINIFDIAFRYIGMGHIEILSCDLKTHLLFYRRDGGSNVYDRELNFKEVIQKSTDDYDKFYFSDWFYNIKFEND